MQLISSFFLVQTKGEEVKKEADQSMEAEKEEAAPENVESDVDLDMEGVVGELF